MSGHTAGSVPPEPPIPVAVVPPLLVAPPTFPAPVPPAPPFELAPVDEELLAVDVVTPVAAAVVVPAPPAPTLRVLPICIPPSVPLTVLLPNVFPWVPAPVAPATVAGSPSSPLQPANASAQSVERATASRVGERTARGARDSGVFGEGLFNVPSTLQQVSGSEKGTSFSSRHVKLCWHRYSFEAQGGGYDPPTSRISPRPLVRASATSAFTERRTFK